MSRVFIALYMIAVSILLLASENRTVIASETAKYRLPAELVARHQAHPGCSKLSELGMPHSQLSFHARLDADTRLYGILCDTAAYNWPYAIYLVRDNGFDAAERVYFADYALESGWIGTAQLFNASFDAKTGLLHSFSKSRGLGDCGSVSTHKWDGNNLNMMEFRYKDACDEDASKPFPLLYRRTITHR